MPVGQCSDFSLAMWVMFLLLFTAGCRLNET